MEDKCKGCEKQQACISFFAHENAMMHKDADNERLANIAKGQRTVNLIQSIIILLVVFCMAMFYTYRTRMWNETIAKQNDTIIKLLNDRSQNAMSGVLRFPSAWTYAGGVFPPVSGTTTTP